jgi:hypothetical protein
VLAETVSVGASGAPATLVSVSCAILGK